MCLASAFAEEGKDGPACVPRGKSRNADCTVRPGVRNSRQVERLACKPTCHAAPRTAVFSAGKRSALRWHVQRAPSGIAAHCIGTCTVLRFPGQHSAPRVPHRNATPPTSLPVLCCRPAPPVPLLSEQEARVQKNPGGMPCVMQLGTPRDGSHIIEKVKVSYSPPCINGTARPRMPLRLPRPRPLPPPCLPG